MGHLGVVLYEYLGEEYPEVLGSILGALKAIVNVIGMTKMTPPIKDLLPRLTPILKNRYTLCAHTFQLIYLSLLALVQMYSYSNYSKHNLICIFVTDILRN